MIVREIELMRCLSRSGNHPNIIPYLGEAKSFRHVYLVFEFADMDLGGYCKTYGRGPRTGSLSDVQARGFMRQLIAGMSFLHRHEVVHRDLKPGNILVTLEGRLMVADFGMASTGTVLANTYTSGAGTLIYRAPEVILGVRDHSSGVQVDMFAVGLTMFECVPPQAPCRSASW